MIQANELRIGNWVYDTRTVGSRVGLPVVLNEKVVKRILEYDVDYYEPIPLTPEILEKCGFEKIYESKIHSTYWINGLSYYYWHERNIQYASFKGLELESKYLHQLQNLYFALTGEELTYTP